MNTQERVIEKATDAAGTMQPAAKANTAPQQNKMLHTVFGVCCLTAPIMLAISSFKPGIDTSMMSEGFKSVAGISTVLNIYSLILWIGAIIGMTQILFPYRPRLALTSGALGITGAVGGTNFLIAYMINTALVQLNMPEETLRQASEVIGLPGILVTAAIGPMFPIALILFGVILIRTKILPLWCGALLTLGGVAFPLGRIPNNSLFIHLADVLLLIPLLWLGWHFLSGKYLAISRHAKNSK